MCKGPLIFVSEKMLVAKSKSLTWRQSFLEFVWHSENDGVLLLVHQSKEIMEMMEKLPSTFPIKEKHFWLIPVLLELAVTTAKPCLRNEWGLGVEESSYSCWKNTRNGFMYYAWVHAETRTFKVWIGYLGVLEAISGWFVVFCGCFRPFPVI